jgi:hypothetical protein
MGKEEEIMRKCVIIALALAVATPAFAQMPTTQQLYQQFLPAPPQGQQTPPPRVFINPNAGGSYTVTTPGQGRTFINPNGGGGYYVTTPGQGRTFVNPSGGGSYTVTTPGQGRTFVNPTAPDDDDDDDE